MKLSFPSPSLPCLLYLRFSLFIFTFFLFCRFHLLPLLLPLRLLPLLILLRLLPLLPPLLLLLRLLLLLLLLLPNPLFLVCLQHLVRPSLSQALRSHPTGPGSIPAYPYKAKPHRPFPPWPRHRPQPVFFKTNPQQHLSGWDRSDGFRLTLRNLP